MAPKDSKIEACLRETVREASKKGDDVTVKRVRKRTEEKLGLETDELKNGAWKDKSKAIIEAAFEEPGEQTKSSPEKEKRKEDQPKPQKQSKSKKDEGKERPSSSGSGSAGAARAPKRPDTTAPAVNGVKRKAAGAEPAAADGSKKRNNTAGKKSSEPPSKKAKTAAAEPPATKRPTEDEDGSSPNSGVSMSSGETGSESGSSQSSDNEVESLPSPAKPPEPTQEDETVRAIPPKTFQPPSGYTPIDSSLLSSASALNHSKPEGKQIWHITAPSNVPISSLTELALSSISSAEPVLTHKNIPYILTEDTTTSSNTNAEPTSLLLPSKEGYQKAPSSRIERTLHLQQKLELPNLSNLQASENTGSKAAGDVAQAPVSTVRPQPKGLRMRFKPPGFGKGRPGFIGGESEEGEEDGSDGGGKEGPSFQFPKTLGEHSVEVRQDGDVEMIDAADAEAEKDGKKKKREEKRDKAEDGEATKVNGVPKSAEATNGLPNGVAEKESKEEKKRRKEEKRARKEAKAKVEA